MNSDGPLLSCDAVSKAFNGVRALDGVSMHFPHQGVVGIVGPNGAGKTTLFNVMTGWEKPDSGQVRLGCQRIDGATPWRIARLGIARTFQELRMVRGLSALDNVLVGLADEDAGGLIQSILRGGLGHGSRRRRRAGMQVLGKVGLSEVALQLAGTLSYGQQKLLTIARSLAMNPRVLLLDEPVAGVHPQVGGTILSLLARLGREGALVVFVEHDLSAVQKAADLVFVMDQGRVVACGVPKETLSKPEVLEAFVG